MKTLLDAFYLIALPVIAFWAHADPWNLGALALAALASIAFAYARVLEDKENTERLIQAYLATQKRLS